MSSRRRGDFETYSKLGNRGQITSLILKKLLLRIPSNSSRSRYTQGENSVALDVYRSFEGNQYHQRRCVSCTSISKYVCNRKVHIFVQSSLHVFASLTSNMF